MKYRSFKSAAFAIIAICSAIPAIASTGGSWTLGTSAVQPASSLTESGTTATLTVTSTAGNYTGETITISGSTPAAYNGNQIVTVASSTTLTFTATSGLGSASGTINATPVATVIFNASTDGGAIRTFSVVNTDLTNDALLTANKLHSNGALDLIPGAAVPITVGLNDSNGLTLISGFSSAGTVVIKGGAIKG